MATDAEDRTEVLGRRIAAALVDLLVLLLLMVILAVLIGDTRTDGGSASFSLNGAPALVWLVLALLYHGVAEAATGQTLGKRLLRVRVASATGGRAGAGQIAGRTLMRLVDGFAFYLVGFIAILATGARRQRLGDLVAGTRVVAADGNGGRATDTPSV